MEKQTENRPMDIGEERREKARCMERVTWKFAICKFAYVK